MVKGLALHTWTLDRTPLGDVVRIARATGWQAVELRRLDFVRGMQAGQSAAEILELVRASGLAVACVGVERGWMFAEGAERRRLLDAFAESCGWAAALGCATIMSPVDAAVGEAARAVASLREVGDIAATHGVRLALEFQSQGRQFATLESLRAILARAGHPQCGLLLDTYHFHRSGADPRQLQRLPPEEVVYLQYSDVPRSGLRPGDTLDRLPPGQGCAPLAAIFGWARQGYGGYLSYEAPNPSAWTRQPEAVAREALEATRSLLAGVTPAA